MTDLGAIAWFKNVNCYVTVDDVYKVDFITDIKNKAIYNKINYDNQDLYFLTGSLSGNVTDSLSSPVSGAMLGLYHRESMELISKTTSDINGNYIFENLKTSVSDYFIVCLDNDTTYDGVVHDNLTAE